MERAVIEEFQEEDSDDLTDEEISAAIDIPTRADFEARIHTLLPPGDVFFERRLKKPHRYIRIRGEGSTILLRTDWVDR